VYFDQEIPDSMDSPIRLIHAKYQLEPIGVACLLEVLPLLYDSFEVVWRDRDVARPMAACESVAEVP
jgi:hypothetical protein